MWKTIRQSARATRHLIQAAVLAFASCLFLCVLLIAAAGTALRVGAWLLPEAVLLLRRVAGAKRRQVAAWTGQEIPEAYRPITGSLRERLRTAVRDPQTHRDLRWLIAHYGYGCLGIVAVLLWLPGLVVDGLWCVLLRRQAVVLPLITRLAHLDSRCSRALLSPSPKARLVDRVEQLTVTRAEALAAHTAELRRVERDLHDGPQARLVALSMRIGVAQRAHDHGPEETRTLLADAQDEVEATLAEFRRIVRGMHPPVLTDRGLVGAVRAFAAGCGLDVLVDVHGLGDDGPRAPAPVESAMYFAVTEALANVAEHSGAHRASVHLDRLPAGLRAIIWDDGLGGADEACGTGLHAVQRRAAALDGIVTVTSLAGGPTAIVVELPCTW
ncbi:sensor domain-containing protein [Streptomyces humi]